MIKTVRLTDVCDFQGGSQPPKSLWSKDFHDGYVRMLQIRDFTQKNESHVEYLKDLKTLKKCKDDDILIGRYGASIGKILTGLSGAYNVAIVKTIPNEKKLYRRYLYYILTGKQFQNFISSIGSRAAQAGFNKTDLKEFQILLPSLEDQKRIVKILDVADALRQKRKKVIKLLDDYLQSSFLQISQKSKQTIKLKLLIKDSKGSARTGPFGSDLKHSEFVDSGVAVIGIDNAVKNKFEWKERRFITEQKYQKLKRYTIFPRDVIITIMGTVGRSAVIPSDIPLSINTKHLAALTLDESKANPYFISHAIHSDPRIKRQIIGNSRGAIMSGLNLGIIKNLELPELGIEDQNRFEQIYLRIESVKQKMLIQSQELEVGFQALMQKAFKGEL